MTQFLLVLVVMINALSVMVVITMVWRRGGLVTRPALTLLAVAAFLYGFGYALELAGTTLEWKRYALAVQYLGTAALPGLVVSVMAGLSNATWLRSRWIQLVTYGGGALAYLAVITSDRHEWFYLALDVVRAGPLRVLDVTPGPAYVAFQLLLAASILTANVVLFRAWRRSSARNAGRLFSVMIASLVPWIANLVYLAGVIPWQLDGAPFFLLPAALLLAWGVRTQGLVDLRPIARDEVVERMREPVVVVDPEGRVVDANPAGRRLLLRLDIDLEGDEGVAADGRLAPWLGGSSDRMPDARDEAGSHLMVDGRDLRVGELDLDDERGRPRGRVLVFHDVTRYARQRRDLEQLASTDDLTGLPNRRGFHETVGRWVATEGDVTRSAWLLIDIDHFKRINDRYGHDAGDRALRAVARDMLLNLRGGDVVARLGGEEFGVFLPGADSAAARTVAERLRSSIERLRIPADPEPLTLTVSIGVHPAPAGAVAIEPLLAKADAAMYRAKRAGRNRVEVTRDALDDAQLDR